MFFLYIAVLFKADGENGFGQPVIPKVTNSDSNFNPNIKPTFMEPYCS